MKRWICIFLTMTLLLTMGIVGAAAEEADTEHTIVVQTLGEGEVGPGKTISVEAGGKVHLWFMPKEGYEVVTVLVDGYPISHVYHMYRHTLNCAGCEECDWIDWSRVYAGIEDDDWSDWKNSVTLYNVNQSHVIYVQFAEIKAEEETPAAPQMPVLADFSDLDGNAWYADAVTYVLQNGLMNGMGEGTFAPDGVTTRAQLVTMLWRLEEKPVVKYDMKLTDVAEGSWYADAVRWAEAEQIVTGSNGQFAPNDPITREQLAAILWRYAKYRELDVSVGENTNILSYNDAFEVSAYAYPALQWTCGAGILNGSDGNLMPQGHATRVQTAAMLYRFQLTVDN